MTITELNNLRYMRKYISQLECKLRELRELVTAQNCNIEKAPSGKGLTDNRSQTLIASIVDLESVIAEERTKAIEEECRLMNYISDIPDSYIKGIMTCRFIQGLSWNATAWKMTCGRCTGNNMIKTVIRYLENE